MLVFTVELQGLLRLLETGKAGKVIQKGLVYFGVIDLHLRTALSRLHLQQLVLDISQNQV
jgi:hypothetical protein